MLWFWLLFLTFITIINFVSWMKTVSSKYRQASVAKYLRAQGKLGDTEKEKEMLALFVNEYCYLDGAFIFQILRRNSNYITTSEIISALWSKYCRDYSRQAYVSKHEVPLDDVSKHVEIGMNNYSDEKQPLRGVPSNSEN